MFVKFSKNVHRKCVFLGGSLVLEYANNIVGIARLHEETDRCLDYDLIVADKCPLGGDKIARCIKDMICKSNKFTLTPTNKRRKYYLEKVDCDVLPIKAEITFTLDKKG